MMQALALTLTDYVAGGFTVTSSSLFVSDLSWLETEIAPLSSALLTCLMHTSSSFFDSSKSCFSCCTLLSFLCTTFCSRRIEFMNLTTKSDWLSQSDRQSASRDSLWVVSLEILGCGSVYRRSSLTLRVAFSSFKALNRSSRSCTSTTFCLSRPSYADC